MVNQPISPEGLAHYGVLGMKWGVRKNGKPQGHQYGKAGQKRAERKARKTERKAEKAERAKLKTPKNATARKNNKTHIWKPTTEQPIR